MDRLTPAQAAERRRCVCSDAARKRGSLRFSLQGEPVPVKFLCRETEEFDARHGLSLGSRTDAGNSTRSEGSSSRPSSLLPRRLELEEAFEDYDPVAFEDAIGPEDFISDDIVEHVTVVVRKRSVAEKRDEDKRRRVDDECNEVLLEQVLFASMKHKEKVEEWETEAKKQRSGRPRRRSRRRSELAVCNGAVASRRAPVKDR